MVVYPSIWEVIIGLSILYFCISTMIKDQIKYYKSQKKKNKISRNKHKR